MSALLCVVMIICLMITKEPAFAIAAGLFALAAEVSSYADSKKEKTGEVPGMKDTTETDIKNNITPYDE